MLLCLGFSQEEIALYRPTDAEYCDCVLSVGLRFTCGGTENVWRITAIDKHGGTVDVVREWPSEQGPYTWNYRSACQGMRALTHAVNL